MKRLITVILVFLNSYCMSQREVCIVEQNEKNQGGQYAEDCLFYFLMTEYNADPNAFENQGLSLDEIKSRKHQMETVRLYFTRLCIQSTKDNEKCQKESPFLPGG